MTQGRWVAPTLRATHPNVSFRPNLASPLDFAPGFAQGCAVTKWWTMSDTNNMQSQQQVYTLLVEVGRKDGDGLPEGATGAALICYASGVDESEAVRETVAILKQAGMNPLDVTGHGTRAEREAEGVEIGEDEAALMARARDENAVIVAQVTPV